MADEEKIGRPWDDAELAAIVEDYFAMLTAELGGRPYVKSYHSKALMERIGRTHRSVEFKHQNISAVLDELGIPWIEGYKPKRNYQSAIFDAIDRYLSAQREVIDLTYVPCAVVSLTELERKFDPVERDFRNRRLGQAGEAFVVEAERQRLLAAGHDEPARKVRWVADLDGDGAGYDVLSYETMARKA